MGGWKKVKRSKKKAAAAAATILDTDVPQAFTHFTYVASNRKKMVCDLQGVLDMETQFPPMFEFTDPCIHYASMHNRSHVFGRTDRGRKGMREFFETHKCNALCKALGLRSKE